MHIPPAGTVLSLEPADWSYGSAAPGTAHVFLRVETVRHELARYYDGRKVWVEGIRLSPDGAPLDRISLLVEIGALAKTVHDDGR